MMTDQPKEVATVDDLFIARDDEGAVLPIEILSPLLGKTVSLRPMTYGYMKKKGLTMEVSAVKWPTEEKLDLVKIHYVEPDMSDLTVEDVEERMGPLTLNHLVSLVVAYSVPMKSRQQNAEQLAATIKEILSKSGMPKANTSSTS